MRNRADPTFRRGGVRAPMTTGCNPAAGPRTGRGSAVERPFPVLPDRAGPDVLLRLVGPVVPVVAAAPLALMPHRRCSAASAPASGLMESCPPTVRMDCRQGPQTSLFVRLKRFTRSRDRLTRSGRTSFGARFSWHVRNRGPETPRPGVPMPQRGDKFSGTHRRARGGSRWPSVSSSSRSRYPMRIPGGSRASVMASMFSADLVIRL